MSMRLLLAGSSGQGSSAGVDGFISRLYDMSAGEIQKFMSIDRNRTLFFAALSGPYPVADLITHPEFATKICESSAAMSVVATSSTAMTAIAASATAMTTVAASTTALTAVFDNGASISAITSSIDAMTVLLNSSVARNFIWLSPKALAGIATIKEPYNYNLATKHPRIRQMYGDPINHYNKVFISGRSMTLIMRCDTSSGNSRWGNPGNTYYLRTLAGGSGSGDNIVDLGTNFVNRVSAYTDIKIYNIHGNGPLHAYVVDMN